MERESTNLERNRSEPIPMVRILPTMLIHPDKIRENQNGLNANNFKPWETELTVSLLSFRDEKPAETSQIPRDPNRILLVGGEIPIKKIQTDQTKAIRMKPEYAAVKNLTRAHAYGISSDQLKLLRRRKPFIVKRGRQTRTYLETVYTAELPVDFTPRSLDPAVRHHKFSFVSPRQLAKILSEEKYRTTLEGRGADEYRLAGSLRVEKKNQIKDGVRAADDTDVGQTRKSLMDATEQFESATRQTVALALIENLDISNANKFDCKFNEDPELGTTGLSWKEYWTKRLNYFALTDETSRKSFNDIYRGFLESYYKHIQHPDLTTKKLVFNAEFWRAAKCVYQDKLTQFNARLYIQSAPREAIQPNFLGSYSDRYIREVLRSNPEYFADFIRFAYESMGVDPQAAGASKKFFRKLLELKRMRVSSKNSDDIAGFQNTEYKLYRTFMEYFLPLSKFNEIERTYQSEKERLQRYKEEYASASQEWDDYRNDMAHAEGTRELATNPAAVTAFEVPINLKVDNLVDHLLGFFNINPQSDSPVLLEKHISFQFRQKLLDIMMSILHTDPYHLQQITRDNNYFVDVLHQMGKRLGEGLLLYSKAARWAKIIRKDELGILQSNPNIKLLAKPDLYSSEVNIYHQQTRLKVRFRFACISDTKSKYQTRRKTYERNRNADEIKDITRFSIIIHDASLDTDNPPSWWRNEMEIREIRKKIIHQLERKIRQTAEDNNQSNLHYEELQDKENRRKDELDGEDPTGGSEASRPFRVLKKYISLSNKELPNSQNTQTQEIRFMPDALAAADWLDDFIRYSGERLIASKLIDFPNVIYTEPNRFESSRLIFRRRKPDEGKGRDKLSVYPILQLTIPPAYEEFLPSYLDLATVNPPNRVLFQRARNYRKK